MWIIWKYTLKSILEKKLRTLLIIFAVSLAGALFIVSSELSDNIASIYEKQYKQSIGNVDLAIGIDEHSPSKSINEDLCTKVQGISRVVPVFYGYGEYKVRNNRQDAWNLVGYDLEDYKAINTLSLVESHLIESFEGNQIIISQKTALKYKLKVGNSIQLKINGTQRKIKIAGIAKAEGLFAHESAGIYGIMPLKILSKFEEENGKPNQIYIKLQEPTKMKEVMTQLNTIYSRYKVEPAFDEAAYKEQMSWMIRPFFLMTLIVVFISGFIIFSSFKVIMLEKLPVVGTFRSIGANQRTMTGVLLMESLGYGLLGGALGLVIGYILLNIIASGMLGNMESIGQSKVQTSTLVLAYLFSVVVALISTLIPVLSVSKISLKDIVLGNHEKVAKKDVPKVIQGLILIIGGLLIAKINGVKYGVITSIGGMLAIIYGVINVLPFLVNQLSRVLGVLYEIVFGNIGRLAAKNIRNNKAALNSITLVTLGLSVVLIISTVTQNLGTQIVNAYEHLYQCQIELGIPEMHLQDIKVLTRVKGVKNVAKVMESEEYKCLELGDSDFKIFAIDDINFDRYMDFQLEGNQTTSLCQLQQERNIFISSIVAKKYNLHKGDEIHFLFDNKERSYTIIDIMDVIWNGGFVGVVPMKYYKQDTGETNYTTAYINVKEGVSEQQVVENIKDKYKDKTIEVYTMESQCLEEKKSNADLMSMISLFGVLTTVIGMVGVINNVLISFIERRKGLAVLRSIGMSQHQMRKMILIEAFGNGVLGSIGGMISSLALVYELNDVLFALNLPITVSYIPELFGMYFIGGSLVTIIGSIFPAHSTPKMNIIEAIKFE